MNSNNEPDETMGGSEALSSKNSTPTSSEESATSNTCSNSGNCTSDAMKRAAAKQLIEKYFYQLINGCGNPFCENKYCASSIESKILSPNEAAAQAIKLCYNDAPLCDSHSHKVARTDIKSHDSSSRRGNTSSKNSEEPHSSHYVLSKKNSDNYWFSNGALLTEELFYQLCDKSIKEKCPEPLLRALYEALAQPAICAKSFTRNVDKETVEAEKDTDKETKESAMSSDPDKDVDSIAGPELDIASWRRALNYLNKVPSDYYRIPLAHALKALAVNLETNLRRKSINIDDAVNCLVIAFEVPVLECVEFIEDAFPALCQATEELPIKGQAKLARIWAQKCKESLPSILDKLQDYITLRLITTYYDIKFNVQMDLYLIAATKTMKILFYANMLAGVMESNSLREESIVLPSRQDPLEDVLGHLYPRTQLRASKMSQFSEPLAIELDTYVLDSRKPYLPFEKFYNEPLNDTIEMDRDYENFKRDKHMHIFSYLRYPFILSPLNKSLGLYYDNRIRMYSERRVSLLHSVVEASHPAPYLRLRVRRHRIIDDALVELEMIAMESAQDLKKQLVVEFDGEEGVDEGGVSKEFFQLIVEEIFNPDYGMFTHQQDSQTVWFNPTSFETDAQFTLIGIVLGLAIYNNVILAVNFPMVVYRKLMGKKGSFEDLADWNPIIYKSLKDILEYSEDDLEEVYYQTYRICYQDVFGNNIFHELKPDGDSIFVTQENKKEFVELYADFLLNKSVETQFRAFRRGFLMVTEESPLSTLFRPEEVEMLVCGSKNFDFNELEDSTEYEAGYASDTKIIREFWEIVHDMSLDDKRKLLEFTTGSDRVPVGGLGHLKMVIARNGPDSDRLPTAHTCFNILLLPEYESKEKLRDRLMKAISYSKGFGML